MLSVEECLPPILVASRLICALHTSTKLMEGWLFHVLEGIMLRIVYYTLVSAAIVIVILYFCTMMSNS